MRKRAGRKQRKKKAKHGNLQTRRNHNAGSSKESVAQPGSSQTFR